MAKVLELHLQHQSFQWIFRVDFPQDWLVWSSWCPRRVFSSSTVQKQQFFSIQPSSWFNSHNYTWLLEMLIKNKTHTYTSRNTHLEEEGRCLLHLRVLHSGLHLWLRWESMQSIFWGTQSGLLCYHTSETAGPKLEGLECLLPQFHHGLGPCCSPRKLMRGKESSWWTPASQTSPSDRSTCQLHLESTGDLLSHSGHTQQQGTLGNTVTGAPHTVSNGWIGLNNRITLRHMLWKAEITFNMFNLLLRKKQRCQVPEMFDHFYSCNNFPCLNRASPFIKHLFLYLFFSSFIECVGGSFSVDFQIWASVIS